MVDTYNQAACKVSETHWRRRYEEEDETTEMEQRKNKSIRRKNERLA